MSETADTVEIVRRRLADADVHRLVAEIDRLRWIIGVVRQDLAENAPNRAEVFLNHQMREPAHP
jgi:hypothetical protein